MSRQVYRQRQSRGSASVIVLGVVLGGLLLAFGATAFPNSQRTVAPDTGATADRQARIARQGPRMGDEPITGDQADGQPGEGQAAGPLPGQGAENPIIQFQIESCGECDSEFVNEGQTNAIATTMLQDRSVGPMKAMLNVFGSGHIQNYSIQAWDMADKTVGSRVLGGDAVTSSHIMNGTITGDDISSTYSNSYLRSDTSDSFTSGTLTFDSSTTIKVSGEIEVYNDAALQTIMIDGEAVTGADFLMYNDNGTLTVDLDSQNSDAGTIAVTNGVSSSNKVLLDGDGSADDGGEVNVYAADGSTTVHLDGEESDNAGGIEVRNSTSSTRVYIDGMDFGGGRIDVRQDDGTSGILLRAEEYDGGGNGSVLEMFAEDGAEVVEIDSGFASGSGVEIYVDGDYTATGTKSAAVTLDSGERRLMYCTESTELWFEDVGSGQLQNGAADVVLDPLFLQTVTINDEYPMRVLITLTDDCNGVYVKKYSDGFSVHELMGGTSNATFDYKVICKRRGYEDQRMALFTRPGNDGPDMPFDQSMYLPTEGLGDPTDGQATGSEQ